MVKIAGCRMSLALMLVYVTPSLGGGRSDATVCACVSLSPSLSLCHALLQRVDYDWNLHEPFVDTCAILCQRSFFTMGEAEIVHLRVLAMFSDMANCARPKNPACCHAPHLLIYLMIVSFQLSGHVLTTWCSNPWQKNMRLTAEGCFVFDQIVRCSVGTTSRQMVREDFCNLVNRAVVMSCTFSSHPYICIYIYIYKHISVPWAVVDFETIAYGFPKLWISPTFTSLANVLNKKESNSDSLWSLILDIDVL